MIKKSVGFGIILSGFIFAFSSCASTKNLPSIEARRDIGTKTKEILSTNENLTYFDAVYTKDGQLRIFINTKDGQVTDELVSKIKKEVADKNNVPLDKILVLEFVDYEKNGK